MTERDIFLSAIDIPDPVARQAFLDRACGENADLRRQVGELLAAHSAAGSFMEPDAGASGGRQPPDTIDHQGADAPRSPQSGDPDRTGPFVASEVVGTTIAGRYKLLEVIGEGGMGTVFMADQTEPVRRRVAVKLVRDDRDSRAILVRFEAERQAIAVMDHPHIAKLLDAGQTDRGRPYFVMELVKGIPLTQFCDAHRLTVPDRLRLFQQICSAVQHAHQKGIIHRDLKPSNVLVESHDGKPVPKVIDFGLAKAASGLRLTDHTLFTGFGSVLGTPQYMAPEQATFNAVDIDTRADVYALGVILYELLAGSPPIRSDSLKRAALDEMLRIIREDDPPPPSSRLAEARTAEGVGRSRRWSFFTPHSEFRTPHFQELDWIVMKALAKERDRRYDTATAFGADVERFLNHEPVAAGPPSAGYRLRKFVQRNRGRVVAAGLLGVAVLLGVAGTTWQLAERRRDREVSAARSRQAVVSALDQAEASLRADKLPEADAALGVAERELAAANAPDLADRLATAKADRAMLDRLRDIFEQAWAFTLAGDGANTRRAVARYAETFDAYGLKLDAPAELTREMLLRAVISNALVSALNDWFFREPTRTGLRQALDACDPDDFRSDVRAAVAAEDADRVRSLAARADGSVLPPGFAAAFGIHPALLESEAGLRMMRAAWLAHPDYYPLVRQIGRRLLHKRLNTDDNSDDVIHWLRMAAALRPDQGVDYFNLAAVWMLGDKRLADGEYEAAVRKSIRLGQNTAAAQVLLGDILTIKRDYQGAEAAFRSAVAINPTYQPAHVGLISILHAKQVWDELVALLRRTKQEPADEEMSENDSYAAFMSGFRTGRILHVTEDLIEELVKSDRPGLAVRYYSDRTDETLGRWPFGQRVYDQKGPPDPEPYNAACAAALAGIGKGKDAPPPDERPAIRRKGLGWLTASVAHWSGCVTLDPSANRGPAHQAMTDWLATPHLKPVRDEAELAALPADEAADWRRLWAGVRALRVRTAPPDIAPPPRPAAK